jgi:hypothetical protein
MQGEVMMKDVLKNALTARRVDLVDSDSDNDHEQGGWSDDD